jgi:hypothetical protein
MYKKMMKSEKKDALSKEHKIQRKVPLPNRRPLGKCKVAHPSWKIV